ERSAPRSPKRKTPPRSDTTSAAPTEVDLDQRSLRCLDAMRRMNMVDHRDGSSRLYAAACRVVEHDLPDAAAISVIRAYAVEKPFPREWSDDEILARLRDANHACQRGCAIQPQLNEDGFVRLGTRDPASG